MGKIILRTVIFYLLTFFFTILIGGSLQVIDIPAELGAGAQWGPGLAALLMLLIFRKDRHKMNFSLKGIPASKFLWAIALPLIPVVVIFPIVWFLMDTFTLELRISVPIYLILISMTIGAVGEEMGWRGYLHSRLKEANLQPLRSSLIVGVLWSFWHIFGIFQNGAVYMLVHAITFTAMTVIMFYLLRDIDFNVWVAAIFHIGISFPSLLYLSVINETRFFILYGVAWMVLALIVYLRYNQPVIKSVKKRSSIS